MFSKFIAGFCMLCLLLSCAGVRHRDPDNKKPIHFLLVRKHFNIRNAAIETAWMLNRKPRENPDLAYIKNHWTLSFQDNFDSLDLRKWRPGQPWGEMHPANPHQYYDAAQVYCQGGFLHLGGAYKPKLIRLGDSSLTVPYATGLVNSDISFQQKYGYFEIRSRNPCGAATWPAFWLTGASRWPPEIDVFEMYGKKSGKQVHKQVQTVHWGKNGHRSKGHLSRGIRLKADTDSSFHTYGCLWQPGSIRFYTDGRLTGYFRLNKAMQEQMDDEMVLILNNGFDRKYLKYLPVPFTGNTFSIDWIRVYKMP